MGTAIARVSKQGLAELMGIATKAEITHVFPPSFVDLSKQYVTMLLESPEFPMTHPAMALPEVHLCYTSKAGRSEFTGFEFVNEKKEPGLVPPDLQDQAIYPVNPTGLQPGTFYPPISPSDIPPLEEDDDDDMEMPPC